MVKLKRLWVAPEDHQDVGGARPRWTTRRPWSAWCPGTTRTPGIKGLRGIRGLRGPRGAQGPQGPRGPAGAGAIAALLATKLDKNADIDMQNNYDILRLKRNPYPICGDLGKAISYEDRREIFLSKKEGGKMEQAIDMNNNAIRVKDPDPSGIDQATNKKYVDTRLATKLDRTEAQKYVKIDGSYGMTGKLDFNDKKIIYLNSDDKDIRYVNNKVNVIIGNVFVRLKNYFDKKINESHISSSNRKQSFQVSYGK